MQFGVHLLIDAYGCNQARLSDKAALEQLLVDLPTELSMHPITKPVVVEVGPNNKKDPGGLSGFVMIAESHISFHTFPKRGFLTADIYTCQNELDAEEVISKLKAFFKSENFDYQVVKRGLHYPPDDIY